MTSIDFRVGDVVEVAHACLDNPPHTRAICYEVYQRTGRVAPGDTVGISLLFPNGNYDGFSRRDRELFGVRVVGHVEYVSTYQFRSVHQLWQDWRQGHFTAAFAEQGR